MSIDKGMFNFQGIMDDFYGYEPGEDDSEGRAQKNSFQANMVQSGFDANLAKDMAYAQSGIAKGNMTHAADLELRNKTALMNDEYNKGMMSMGGQFEFQNRFAEDQNVRDITKDTTNTATQFEFGNKAQENQNIRDITKDSIERADNFEYANQGAENQSVRDVNQQAAIAGVNFDMADKMADNNNIRDMAKIGFTGDEQRKTLAATGTQNRLDYVVQGEQNRYGTMQQGDETRRSDSNRAEENRETMREGDRIEAGKQNRQSARSRAAARSF
tara:strand:- start:147 stop:962 length:816 start_codon:yes stop_codon:yes gene_type:complete